MSEHRHDHTAVDWEVASATARKALSWKPPLDDTVRLEVEADFAESTRRAEALVAEVTGFRPARGHARSVTVDRPEWVDANLASFERLLSPVFDKQKESTFSKVMAKSSLGRQAAGVEIGLLLAWMSSRVLGQYDA
ncbi:MAG TPA: zinc-dependent metalloprotease, partial [Acidimicrobiales bacterium]|nr:zinc-dependent metalloprotease [Acidimicrobiales bacterium]